jgi:hypothetical protein
MCLQVSGQPVPGTLYSERYNYTLDHVHMDDESEHDGDYVDYGNGMVGSVATSCYECLILLITQPADMTLPVCKNVQ